jgi:predicted nuclease with TOPRIM domain
MTFQGFAVVEVTQDLIYEVLRKVQTDVSFLKDNVRELRQDNASIRNHLHMLQGDVNNLHGTGGQVVDRLERIENRLDLREFAQAQARFEPHP